MALGVWRGHQRAAPTQKPETVKNIQLQTFDPDQIKRIAACLYGRGKHDEARLFVFLTEQGCRFSEAMRLKARTSTWSATPSRSSRRSPTTRTAIACSGSRHGRWRWCSSRCRRHRKSYGCGITTRSYKPLSQRSTSLDRHAPTNPHGSAHLRLMGRRPIQSEIGSDTTHTSRQCTSTLGRWMPAGRFAGTASNALQRPREGAAYKRRWLDCRWREANPEKAREIANKQQSFQGSTAEIEPGY